MSCFLLTMCHYFNQRCVNMITSWHGLPLYWPFIRIHWSLLDSFQRASHANLSSFFDISRQKCWTNTRIASDPRRSCDVFIISPMRSSASPFPANVMGYDQKIQHWNVFENYAFRTTKLIARDQRVEVHSAYYSYCFYFGMATKYN